MSNGMEPSITRLMADARGRIEAFRVRGAVEGLAAEDVSRLAEALWTGAKDEQGAVPLEVALVVGELYLSRYHSGAATGTEERDAALVVFSMVGQVAPDRVPDAVRELIDEVKVGQTRRAIDVTAAVDLLTAAQSSAEPDVLDEAVRAFRRLRASGTADDPYSYAVLSNLGLALRLQAQRNGQLADLDEGVLLAEAAVEAPHLPNEHAPLLMNAASALGTRFTWTGDLTDLNRAVELATEATEHADDDAWPGAASDLSGMLRLRFDRLAHREDLERALDLSKRAAEVSPEDAPAAGLRWSNLSNTLATRFGLTRDLADLAAAIGAGRRALGLAPSSHHSRPAIIANLANLVLERFDQLGELADVAEAITLGEQALATGRISGPALASLESNVGNAYRTRYEHQQRLQDLDRALELCRAGVDRTGPADPHLPSRLSNLAMALLDSYERTSAPADLEEACRAGEAAVEAAGSQGASRSKYLSNLLVLLAARARAQHGPGALRQDTLDAAVESGRAAVAALSPDDLSMPVRMINLAGALLDRVRAGDAVEEHRTEALALYHRAATTETAPSAIRIHAARFRGDAAAVFGLWPTALESYDLGVSLLSRLVTRAITRRSREELLARTGRLASDGAACAIMMEDTRQAVGLLEQGRSVLWSQALDGEAGALGSAGAAGLRLAAIAEELG